MYCSATKKFRFEYISEETVRIGLFKREKRVVRRNTVRFIEVPFCKEEFAEQELEKAAKEFATSCDRFVGYSRYDEDGSEFDAKVIPWVDRKFGEAINRLTLSQYIDVCKEYNDVGIKE